MKFPFTKMVRRAGYAAVLPGFLDYPTYVAKTSRCVTSEGGGALARRLRILFPGQDGARGLTTTLCEGIQPGTKTFHFVFSRIQV